MGERDYRLLSILLGCWLGLPSTLVHKVLSLVGAVVEGKREAEREGVRYCRPLGFLLGLPFALVASVFSLVGAVIWIIVWVIECALCCCCPCCPYCCKRSVEFVNLVVNDFAVTLLKLPIEILRWFMGKIPY